MCRLLLTSICGGALPITSNRLSLAGSTVETGHPGALWVKRMLTRISSAISSRISISTPEANPVCVCDEGRVLAPKRTVPCTSSTPDPAKKASARMPSVRSWRSKKALPISRSPSASCSIIAGRGRSLLKKSGVSTKTVESTCHTRIPEEGTNMS